MSMLRYLGKRENQLRILLIITIPIILVPLMLPAVGLPAIGLPIPISQEAYTAYNALENVEPGSVLMLTMLCDLYTVGPLTHVIIQQAFTLVRERDCQVVMFLDSYLPPTPLYLQEYETQQKMGTFSGLTYGVDYVFLGWIVGGEPALHTIATDLWKACNGVDWEGTSLDQLPMMEHIRSFADYDYIWGGYSSNIEMNVRQWGPYIVEYGVPFVVNLLSAEAALAQPYVTSGFITAILIGQKGSAEYESILKKPGIASSFMDVQSTIHLYTLALMAVAIVYAGTQKIRKNSKPVEAEQ